MNFDMRFCTPKATRSNVFLFNFNPCKFKLVKAIEIRIWCMNGPKLDQKQKRSTRNMLEFVSTRISDVYAKIQPKYPRFGRCMA